MLSYIHNMAKMKLEAILIVIVCFFCISSKSIKAVSLTPVQGENTKIILIDPGHGGFDGGAETKSGDKEKHINLSISLKLRDKLKAKGYEVLMTRESDIGLYSLTDKQRSKKSQDLNNRCKIKNQSNCDLFISVHQNYFEDSYYHGAQVWYSQYDDSKKLAHIIQENFKKDLDEKNHRVEKPAGNSYKVLRCQDNVPSVIVECGFLTNPTEEKKLRSEEYQAKIAESLSKSIKEYFQLEEQKVIND